MISLVIVSHSAKLAEGIVELARGMSGPDVRIAVAGGLEPPDSSLGTDPMRVLNAIEAVYSDDGVLVLMDLGSAVMSAEMAVELLEPGRRAHILLCEAPLVEGAVIGAVQARLGSSLEQAAIEVRGALAGKQEQLGVQPVNVTTPGLEPPPDQPDHSLRLVTHNRVGLHARPASRLVQAINGLKADVYTRNVSAGGKLVSARSINGLLMLGVRQNHEIEFVASGPQADEALDAIRQLAENNFGDAPDHGDQTAPAKQTLARAGIPLVDGILMGLPASAGRAVGPARLFRRELPEISTDAAGDPQAEWDALTAALDKTRAQLRAQQAKDRTGIFEAHLLFLDDEALVEPARRAIFETKLSATAAWQRAVDSVIAGYQTLDDDYLRTRAADVQAVGQQTLINLLGQAMTHPAMDAPGILIAEDLTPGDIAPLDPANVRGICTAAGSPTSHAAILARTLGIPMVTGLGDAILNVGDGTQLALNGDTGQVFLQPDSATVKSFTAQAEALHAEKIQALTESAEPAVTRDGRRIEVVANVGSIADIHDAVHSGAEGVGVLRTEFLFLDRQTAPDEDEQYAAYHEAAEALGGRPLIIRTLDVGGDKPLPYLAQGYEANPFLGWRAVRLCLDYPDMFKAQLRAAARAAATFPIKIMFPMIATLAEFRAAKQLLDEVAPGPVETGIMVEIPSAALLADEFAAEVDFLSIGTNDLTQYTLAAERGNPRVAGLADNFQPAVLRLIQRVVEAGHAHGKWVGVCGEMAADPLAIPLLVGLGVDELSMSASAIPRAKQIIRTVDHAAMAKAAAAILALESAEAIRAALGKHS